MKIDEVKREQSLLQIVLKASLILTSVLIATLFILLSQYNKLSADNDLKQGRIDSLEVASRSVNDNLSPFNKP